MDFINYIIADWKTKNAFELNNKRKELLLHKDNMVLYRCFSNLSDNKIRVSPIGEGMPISVEVRKDFMTISEFILTQEKNSNKSVTNQISISNKSVTNQKKIRKEFDFDYINNNNKSVFKQLDISDKSEFIYLKTGKLIERLSKKLDNTKPSNLITLNKLIGLQKKAVGFHESQDIQEQIEVYSEIKNIITLKNKYKKQTEKARINLPEPIGYKDYLKLHKEVAKLISNPKFIRKASGGRYRNFKSLPKNMPNCFERAVAENYVFRPDGRPYKIGMLTDVADAIRKNSDNIKKWQKIKLRAVFMFLIVGFFVFGYSYKNKVISEQIKIQTFDSIVVRKCVEVYNNKTNKGLSNWQKGFISKKLSNKSTVNIYKDIDSLINKRFNK